jgi:hypothetical protein
MYNEAASAVEVCIGGGHRLEGKEGQCGLQSREALECESGRVHSFEVWRFPFR